MSGIFKGDSIYKGGGGGGGFKNGGALVDGDFIAVDNNAISTYDNESRDPVNFYFDVKPGEVINSVIEFTTQVNATVNVYVVNSAGELVPIGNIGGNTVTAGESYNIVVVGNSFIIEQVTSPLNPDEPKAVIIGGELYQTKKINNRIWLTDALGVDIPGAIDNPFTIKGNKLYPQGSVNTINSILSGGWHVADTSDFQDLANSGVTVDELKSVSYWDGAPGNNSAGMNFYPCGEYQGNGTYFLKGRLSYSILNENVSNNFCRIGNYSTTYYDTRRIWDYVIGDVSWCGCARVCKLV